MGAKTGSRERSQQAVSAASGFDPERDGFVSFSAREMIREAIADPQSRVERYRGKGVIELESSWQARAAIDAVMECARKSPGFALAIATEARRAET